MFNAKYVRHNGFVLVARKVLQDLSYPEITKTYTLIGVDQVLVCFDNGVIGHCVVLLLSKAEEEFRTDLSSGRWEDLDFGDEPAGAFARPGKPNELCILYPGSRVYKNEADTIGIALRDLPEYCDHFGPVRFVYED